MTATADLKNIPRNWEIKPFKSVIKFGKGLSITKENLTDRGIQCLNYGEIHSKFPFEVIPSEDSLPFVSPNYLDTDEKSLVKPGDIVFADTSEDIEGAGNFTQILGDESIFAGYHTVITRPVSSVNHRYLAYVLESEEFRVQIRSKVKGVKVYSVTKGILGNTKVWFPDVEIQGYIASYLDTQTKRIDALVDEKKSFINLLKEKRQALISHYVTKGLDPSVEIKDSGVRWLGGIPNDWFVSKLKYVASCNDDVLQETTEHNYELNYVDIGSVSAVNGIEEKHTYTFDEAPSRARRRVKHGDVIVSTVRTYLEAIAPINNPEDNLIVSTGFAVIRPLKADSKYLQYFLRSRQFIQTVISRSTGVSYPAITATSLMNIEICIPPEEIQQEISKTIENKLLVMDEAVKEVEESVKLLIESRKALISAVVSGKIDVREMVSPKE